MPSASRDGIGNGQAAWPAAMARGMLCAVYGLAIAGALVGCAGASQRTMAGRGTESRAILARGSTTILAGRLPFGPEFAVSTGETFRFDGYTYDEISLGIGVPGGPASTLAVSAREAGAFAWLMGGCNNHRYSVVYGHVSEPGTRVYAMTDDGTHALRAISSARVGERPGTVLYAALTAPLRKLVVRDGSGRVLLVRDVAPRGAGPERCYNEIDGSTRTVRKAGGSAVANRRQLREL